MTHIKSRGSLFILAFIALYTILHIAYMSAGGADLLDAIFLWSGPVSLICMAFAILISVRPKRVEGYFGGLDRMYQVHKWLGITAMLCFALHFALTFGDGGGPGMGPDGGGMPDGDDDPGGPGGGGGDLIEASGMYPMIGFFLLIVLTLNRKFPYHYWIKTHLLMGVLFIGVSFHAFLVLREGREIEMVSLPGALILLTIVTGVSAYIYKQTLYRSSQKHEFSLSQVNRLERATELVLTPKNKRFDFTPGQFAFLRIKDKDFDEAHPFTISSGIDDGDIRFTLKMLGDFTRRVHAKLKPGAQVWIEGPYGRFNPMGGAAKQVWVAGGIGITPFLSTLRSISERHGKTIDLFYCVREESEALYLEELQSIAQREPGITLHLFRSDVEGRLTAQEITERVDSVTERSFYFCGPKPMLSALTTGLEEKGAKKSQFHFEEFEMR